MVVTAAPLQGPCCMRRRRAPAEGKPGRWTPVSTAAAEGNKAAELHNSKAALQRCAPWV